MGVTALRWCVDPRLFEHLDKTSLEVPNLLNVAFNVLWNAIHVP